MTTDDTVTAKLAELEALTEAATEGPWLPSVRHPFDEGRRAVAVGHGEDHGAFLDADAEFIAAAREMVPALLAAVKDVLRVCDERRGDCGDDYADGWTQGWADALLEVRRAVTKRIGGEG